MSIATFAKAEFAKSLIEKITHGDTGSTLLGLTGSAILASGINMADFFDADQTRKMRAYGTLAGVVLISVWGWFTGKKHS